jgi:predicted ATPase
MEAKHGNSFGQGASHCRTFAALALEQAKEADALAAFHEDMAKTAAQKQ